MPMLEREGAMRVCALLLAVVVLVIADDKRAEMSPVPFVLGSRYGRSPSGPRLLAPRNDRFFMGSRYGKRSEPDPLTGGDTGPDSVGAAMMTSSAVTSSMLCEPLGALFRCRPAPHWLDNRRQDEENLLSEE